MTEAVLTYDYGGRTQEENVLRSSPNDVMKGFEAKACLLTSFSGSQQDDGNQVSWMVAPLSLKASRRHCSMFPSSFSVLSIHSNALQRR